MAKKQRKFPRLRFRKDDPEHNLHAAVQHWVKSRGGELIVTGPIQVQDWREGVGKFRVALCCLGRAPTPESPTHKR